MRQLCRSLTCLWAEAGHRGLSHTFRLAPVCPAHAMVLFTFAECRDRAGGLGARSPVPASGPHRGSPGKPVTTPGRLQSATSALGWGKSKSVSMCFGESWFLLTTPVNPLVFKLIRNSSLCWSQCWVPKERA